MKGRPVEKIEFIKKAVTVVVGMGTTKIVAGIIQNNTNPEKVTDKVTILTASLVLGGMAADAASKYTNVKIDQMAEWWDKNITRTR